MASGAPTCPPSCLGIALASGAPLFAGIISGIVGGIVVGTLSPPAGLQPVAHADRAERVAARRPMLHGIVYDLHDGLLKQLVLLVDGQDKVRALLEADRRGVGV